MRWYAKNITLVRILGSCYQSLNMCVLDNMGNKNISGMDQVFIGC